jgi:hypothetical protein
VSGIPQRPANRVASRARARPSVDAMYPLVLVIKMVLPAPGEAADDAITRE